MSLDFEGQRFGGFVGQNCFDICLILPLPRLALDGCCPLGLQEILAHRQREFLSDGI